MNNENPYNKEKTFEYNAPEKKNELYEKLSNDNKKLLENYQRLDMNMKTMYNDNKTLRKHILGQERRMRGLYDEIAELKKQILRSNSLIEAMLKNDEQRIK
jgi:hypothetical protein